VALIDVLRSDAPSVPIAVRKMIERGHQKANDRRRIVSNHSHSWRRHLADVRGESKSRY